MASDHSVYRSVYWLERHDSRPNGLVQGHARTGAAHVSHGQTDDSEGAYSTQLKIGIGASEPGSRREPTVAIGRQVYPGVTDTVALAGARDRSPGRALILDQFVAIALKDVDGWDISRTGPWDTFTYGRWLGGGSTLGERRIWSVSGSDSELRGVRRRFRVAVLVPIAAVRTQGRTRWCAVIARDPPVPGVVGCGTASPTRDRLHASRRSAVSTPKTWRQCQPSAARRSDHPGGRCLRHRWECLPGYAQSAVASPELRTTAPPST